MVVLVLSIQLNVLKAVIKAIDTERYVTMGENKFSRAATGDLKSCRNHGCRRHELW